MTTRVAWPPPPPPPPPSAPRGQSRAPGAIFYLVTGIAILIAVDASSRRSLWVFVVGGVVWILIAAVWCIRLASTASRSGLQMPAARWVRWLAIPVAMGLVFVVGLSGMVFGARFAASRGALDQMAAEVTAGGSTERGWVGLYDVGQVERTANGFRFVIDDSGLSRIGVAYSTGGEPVFTEDNYSPLWEGPFGFESLGGGWWLWAEEWD